MVSQELDYTHIPNKKDKSKKEKLFTAWEVRGNSNQEVNNLRPKESEEWINRSKRGSSFVIKEQKKRL